MYVPWYRSNMGAMARNTPYYYPKISRFLVSVLYHEARSRQMPMTALTEALLREMLEGSKSWRTAEAAARRGHSAAISPAGMGNGEAGCARPVAAERAAARASRAASAATRASKGTTLQRL